MGPDAGVLMPPGRIEHDHVGQRAAEERIGVLKAKGGAFVVAVEATRMPMVLTDPNLDGNPIIYANAAFLKLCGYDMEEVLGRNYTFMMGENSDPVMKERITAPVQLRHGLTEDVRIFRKDGTPIWTVIFIGPVVENGRVVQHLTSFLDITRRIELERALKEAKASLEHRVAEKTRKLKGTNEKLREEVDRRINVEAMLRDTLAQREEDLCYRTFLAREIDHRAKNALQMASSLLMVQASRTDDPAAVQALRSAKERLERMAEIHAVLYQGEQTGTVDFAAYLCRLVREMGDVLQPTPGQIKVDVDADPASWGADFVIPLGLIVGEAITNAMKHAFPHGRRGRVVVGLRVKGGLVRLTIEDDGVGLPPTYRGGALGLELIQTFANQVRGKAVMEPGRAGGTCVTVTFPDPNAANTAEPMIGPRPGGEQQA